MGKPSNAPWYDKAYGPAVCSFAASSAMLSGYVWGASQDDQAPKWVSHVLVGLIFAFAVAWAWRMWRWLSTEQRGLDRVETMIRELEAEEQRRDDPGASRRPN